MISAVALLISLDGVIITPYSGVWTLFLWLQAAVLYFRLSYNDTRRNFTTRAVPGLESIMVSGLINHPSTNGGGCNL